MSAAQSIPEPRSEDDEDVHWALSTATALLSRGDPQEALKWLRRAAETASDANRDARALELFKAAADFSAQLRSSVAPPSMSQPPPSMSQPPPPASTSQPPPASTSQPPRSMSQPPQLPIAQRSPSHLPSAPPPQSLQRPMSGRSSPPPPPRGRIPSIPPERASHVPDANAHHVMEAVAPTVPHPHPAGPTGSGRAPIEPRVSFAATQIAGMPKPAPLARGGAKTLASNVTVDAHDGANRDALRVAVEKATAITDASARDLASRAARQMIGSSIAGSRLTTPGVGPDRKSDVPSARPTPNVDARPREPKIIPPAQATGARGSVAGPPSSREPSTSQPPATPQSGAPASRGRRRTTLSGRRTKSDTTTPPSSASGRSQDRKETRKIPEPRPTGRFEDEITAVRDLSKVRANIADLEEHTNVLNGSEAFVEVVGDGSNGVAVEPVSASASTAPQPRALEETSLSAESHGDIGIESTDPGTSIDLPPTEVFPPTRAAAELGALSAFRVGFAIDPVRGKIDVIQLAPGEPAPSGRVAALVVPTDVSSSALLAELFAKVRNNGDGGRRK
ncbi:MAG: hypothetical protein HOW73_01250 [Polyangiaceae bacterium]|nr:hypothetical protein [Polyangiaceae bacterium]